MLHIAFFDSKEYDRQSFEAANSNDEFDIRFLETRLIPDTYKLAEDCDVVCCFVNDDVNSFVIDKLYSMGIELIALRCADYNNVDVEFAYGKVHVVRVPAYSRMQLLSMQWHYYLHLFVGSIRHTSEQRISTSVLRA